MRFNINKSELLNALTIVAKGASTRSVLPVLSGVYIKAEGAGLTLQTTDLERSIRYDVMALVEEPGETVIPEKLLLDIVKNLPDAAVEFKTDNGSVAVSCDSASYMLKTLDPEDFPAFPEVNVKSRIMVPFSEFCKMVKRVAKVVSKDQSRVVMTGVLISTTDSGLRMVATDSYRLAICDVAAPGVEEGFEAIVSGAFLQEVASLPALADSIEIGLSENQVVFEFQKMVLINRRIEGSFPNYRQLIPDSYVTKTCFTTSDLITAVRRVSLISGPTEPVKFDINKDAKNALITSMSQDVGTAEEILPCEVSGDNALIAFNHQYVLDGLTSVGTSQVFLETQSSLKPGIFKSAGDESFLYLVMPVRIS